MSKTMRFANHPQHLWRRYLQSAATSSPTWWWPLFYPRVQFILLHSLLRNGTKCVWDRYFDINYVQIRNTSLPEHSPFLYLLRSIKYKCHRSWRWMFWWAELLLSDSSSGEWWDMFMVKCSNNTNPSISLTFCSLLPPFFAISMHSKCRAMIGLMELQSNWYQHRCCARKWGR